MFIEETTDVMMRALTGGFERNGDVTPTVGHPAYNTAEVVYPMADATNLESFEEIVEWAYGTLPKEIRDLPDFPGIQVADEPPEAEKREVLGLFSGAHRTERLHNLIRKAPDLIFVFRGPILRHTRRDLRAEVKEVVWHEVAHWLGHNEEQVRDLGLSTLSLPIKHVDHGNLASKVKAVEKATPPQRQLPDTPDEEVETEEQQPRCLKCYSADVTCTTVRAPLSYAGANSFDPITVRAKAYRCNSCGIQWHDEDTD